LFLVSVRTGEKHRLTQPPADTLEDIAPAVSPDGRTLAFNRYSEGVVPHDIYLLPLGPDKTAQGDPVKLAAASPDWRLSALGQSWLPGGRELLVVGGSGLWRMVPSSPAQARRVTLPGLIGGKVAVSPRGDRLVYTSIRSDSNIWRLDMSAPDRRSWKTEKVDRLDPIRGGAGLLSGRQTHRVRFQPVGGARDLRV
jgi:Tol biopolymer transport system component